MKTPTKILAAVIFAGCFLFAFTANAETIVSQTGFGQTATSTNNNYYQTFGTGISGLLENVTVRFGIAAGSTSGNINTQIVSCTNSSYTAGCSAETGTVNVVAVTSAAIAGASYNIDFSASNVVFDSARYYYISIIPSGAGINGGADTNRLIIYGSASNSYANGACNVTTANTGGCGSVSDAYFVVNGQTESVNSSSGIVSLNTPTPGQVTATNAVTFNFTYYNNSTYIIAGINLVDITAGQSVVGATTSISSTGTASPSLTRFLTSGHQYRWSAYIEKADGTRLTSQTRTFYVVSTPSFSSSSASLVPIETVTADNASSTVDQYAQAFKSFLAMFATQFPINWFYEIGTILKDTTGTSTTPGWTADFTSYNASNTQSFIPDEIEILTDDVITSWVPSEEWQDIRDILAAIEWVGFAFFFFYRVRSVTV